MNRKLSFSGDYFLYDIFLSRNISFRFARLIMICFISETDFCIHYTLKQLYIKYPARAKYYTIQDYDTRIYMKFMDPMTLNQANWRSGTFIVVQFTDTGFDRRVLFPWVLFSALAYVYLLIYHFYRIIDQFNYRTSCTKFYNLHFQTINLARVYYILRQ